ncbi:hypothetical protein EDB80DRAFT_877521 [Ilyonectria destructans]|nr:hypothetical protein EDB80DRAFT_877521 [Ilyonectria destructans]
MRFHITEQGIQELERLYQECLNGGDLVGAASCQLILGDNRLSLPFTSPIVLNMALMNGISSGLTDWHDSLETGYPLTSDSEAEQFYQRAFELFGAAGSIRGTAAVHLRRGCVALAEYLNAVFPGPDLITPLPEIDTWRGLAESELDYAFDLYQGGGGMERLVSAHRIILKILVSCSPNTLQHPAGESYDTVSDVANIGTWNNANMGAARLSDLLFLGVGRRLFTAPQNLDAAFLCCACARSCFRGAEERILELHATIQQAKFHRSHGVMDLARSYLDTATATSIYVINRRANGWAAQRRIRPPEEDGSMVTGLFNSAIDNLMNLNNTSVTGAILGTGIGSTTGTNVAESAEAQPAQPEADESNEPLSMPSLLKQFVGSSMTDISGIRRQFKRAIADRKKVLVVHNDWQKGQEYLEGVLQSLDRSGLVKSSELYTRATVLHYLGRNDEIQQWLPGAIPTMFGGRIGDLAGYLAKLRSDLREEIESPSRAMILARLHRPHSAADARSLYESIPDDAIVIHMISSRDGALMLYVSCKGVELARPSYFTDQQIERHVLKYLKLFKNADIYNLPSETEYQGLLEELSDKIISPARQLIDGRSHLIFGPSRSLNKFPFSALLLNGEPLFLQKDVSVVPSLSVLRHLVQMAHERTKDHAAIRAAVIYKAPAKNDLVKNNPGVPPNISGAAAIEIAFRLGCGPEAAQGQRRDV